MKRLAIAASLCILSTTSLVASDTPLWLRHQRISPDGKTIAFCYQGDIYTVPSTGGKATRITSHTAYDHAPIWSLDSKHIAFASDREGSDDIYLVGAEGGIAKRLTYDNSVGEVPQTFAPDGSIVYSAWGMPTRNFDQYPNMAMKQLYSISTKGGRPRMLSSLTMQHISYNKGGDILYTDYKGYEDEWRKHHTSSIARDIWLKKANGTYTKLTSFAGEDRNAVWDDRGGFYYLSEQDGTFNVFHRSATSAKGKDKQLTHFKGNPVRFLSRSNDGLLCFGYDGEIYTMQEGQRPRKVAVSIISDVAPSDHIIRWRNSGAQAYAVAPGGDEFAVVVHGDVFVVNSEYGTSRRITDTPEEERGVTFAADGRTLVYASMRQGQWQLYKTELVRKDDKKFVYAKELRETQLTREDKPCFQPLFNPKGTEIAFLRDRSEVAVISIKGGHIRSVVPKEAAYSYSDGDQHFEWSRNGKYILTQYYGEGGWLSPDCALYRADGSGMEVNLTRSGYSDTRGRFALGDKAVLFVSDRNGYRSHGSWGATGDVYLMFLEDKAYHDFCMSKEERALSKAEEEATKEDATKGKDESKVDKKGSDKAKGEGDKKQSEEQKEEDIKFNFSERDNRTIRISRTSGGISDAVMSADGKKLYFVARYEQSTDLWEYNLEDRSSRILVAGASGSFLVSADGKKIYLQSHNSLREVGGKTYGFNVEQLHHPMSERKHLFDHIQTTMRDKFYLKDLHGVDWAAYGRTYAKFLPHITHDRDFGELLSEMLGELNVSHTGARYMASSSSSQPTGQLGAFFDEEHQGDGLRVTEIPLGSPLQFASRSIQVGDIIESIDGKLIKTGEAIEPLLNGKVGKRVLLGVRTTGGKTFESSVKPISHSAVYNLLSERWIRRREALVREWSEGRIGYVHVPQMNSPAFRSVFKDILGKYRKCEAIVVDTRYNGGGWLHEDLAVLLSGKKFSTMSARGQYLGEDPFMQWNKPSCVLMNEGNYSNGHGFPYTYKTLGLGKLIGTPVPGTMTAVWWERLFSGTIVYGIPQVAMNDTKGKPLENQQLMPDIEVYNSPEDYLEGHDRQLKRAVSELLK